MHRCELGLKPSSCWHPILAVTLVYQNMAEWPKRLTSSLHLGTGSFLNEYIEQMAGAFLLQLGWSAGSILTCLLYGSVVHTSALWIKSRMWTLHSRGLLPTWSSMDDFFLDLPMTLPSRISLKARASTCLSKRRLEERWPSPLPVFPTCSWSRDTQVF